MDPIEPNPGTVLSRFERVLAQPQFEGLKALLDRLSFERATLPGLVLEEGTFDALLTRVGYRLTIVRQIHVQDCYGRLGAAGGIKSVLPYYDIPTQRSLPSLVNLDGTVTATPAAAAFFETLFLELKRQLQAQGQALL